MGEIGLNLDFLNPRPEYSPLNHGPYNKTLNDKHAQFTHVRISQDKYLLLSKINSVVFRIKLKD